MKKVKSNKKHYVLISGIVVLICCAIFSAINISQKMDRDDINISPLATNEILYTDAKNALKEINADTFLVVSYTGDATIHKTEKDIEKYLKRVNLLDNVMYLDAKLYIGKENYIYDLNKLLKLDDTNKISKLPAVIFYKDGSISEVRDSKKSMINKDTFKKYIDNNGLAS